ncbi:MAG: ribonuclease III [Alphaproteobacteria bacterium 41-28]|nr:MAG: ribonuclease III [Alphaproteobacteria bacterium 41-28]
MKGLEENLGYTFKDLSFLEKALTHPSALPPGQGVDFERLEFLGDRVLGLIVATWLFKEFPREKEGDLARRFAGLVRKETLVEVAQSIHLDQAMIMKREKSSSQQKRMDTLLSDGCEALIGALYLEGGLAAAQSFIYRHWDHYFKGNHEPPRDPKSILQEWVQGHRKTHPKYVVIESSGPAHAPQFIVEVRVEGLDPTRGEGSSKRRAEQEAAQRMLNVIVAHD